MHIWLLFDFDVKVSTDKKHVFFSFPCSPRKLLCMSRTGVYTPETHQVTPMALRAEQVCAYDLDDVDRRWLTAVNGERSLTGTPLQFYENDEISLQ